MKRHPSISRVLTQGSLPFLHDIGIGQYANEGYQGGQEDRVEGDYVIPAQVRVDATGDGGKDRDAYTRPTVGYSCCKGLTLFEKVRRAGDSWKVEAAKGQAHQAAIE